MAATLFPAEPAWKPTRGFGPFIAKTEHSPVDPLWKLADQLLSIGLGGTEYMQLWKHKLKVPWWHVCQWVIWLFTGLPLQWFFTAFNGLSFFTLPDPPGPDGVSVTSWVLVALFLYHPILLAPLALWQGWRRAKKVKVLTPDQ